MYLDRHYRHLWWTILTAFTSIHMRSGNNDSHCPQSAARHSERSGIACLSHPWRQASYGLCMATQFAPALCSPTGSPCQAAAPGCTPRSACSVRLFTSVSLQRPAVRLGQPAVSACTPWSGSIVRLFTSVSLHCQAVHLGQAAAPGCTAWVLHQTLGSDQKKG